MNNSSKNYQWRDHNKFKQLDDCNNGEKFVFLLRHRIENVIYFNDIKEKKDQIARMSIENNIQEILNAFKYKKTSFYEYFKLNNYLNQSNEDKEKILRSFLLLKEFPNNYLLRAIGIDIRWPDFSIEKEIANKSYNRYYVDLVKNNNKSHYDHYYVFFTENNYYINNCLMPRILYNSKTNKLGVLDNFL